MVSGDDDRVLPPVRVGDELIGGVIVMPDFVIDQVAILIFAPGIKIDNRFPAPIREKFQGERFFIPGIKFPH